MIDPIVAYGDPVLRKKAESISNDYPKLMTIIDNMFKTMYHSQGVGLAAPQVGISIRLFVIDSTPFKEDDESADGFKRVFINPEDMNFETHIEEFSGIKARIIQHEYDHLEGILFTDKLTPLKKTLLKGRLMDISKGKVDVDYKMKFNQKR